MLSYFCFVADVVLFFFRVCVAVWRKAAVPRCTTQERGNKRKINASTPFFVDEYVGDSAIPPQKRVAAATKHRERRSGAVKESAKKKVDRREDEHQCRANEGVVSHHIHAQCNAGSAVEPQPKAATTKRIRKREISHPLLCNLPTATRSATRSGNQH